MTEIQTPRSQYMQIAELLRDRIADGTYAPSSPLPSEDRLAEELGVSRVTVNRAIGLLRLSGDVRVRRGVGTLVRELPRIDRSAQGRYAARNQGAGAGAVEISKLGRTPRTAYREIGQAEAPANVAKILDLGSGGALVRRRVLYADEKPTQIADSYFPWWLADRSPALLQEDSGRGGSYGRLAEIGYGPVKFSEAVDVRMPTEPEQHTLDLEPSQAVFEIRHIAYTASDQPIEVCVHVMPGHLWTLHYEWADQPADQ